MNHKLTSYHKLSHYRKLQVTRAQPIPGSIKLYIRFSMWYFLEHCSEVILHSCMKILKFLAYSSIPVMQIAQSANGRNLSVQTTPSVDRKAWNTVVT